MKPKKPALHTVYDLKAIWYGYTKYRDKVLTKDVGKRFRTLVRQTCVANDIEIIQGVVSTGPCASLYLLSAPVIGE